VELLYKIYQIMALVSSFLSSSFTKLAVCIFNLDLWSSIFLSQSFESCGIFLQDFQPYTEEQGDFMYKIIEHLGLNQTRAMALIIKTEISKKKIHSNIFRSMMSMLTFVHEHLFSTIPSFEKPLQSALYQRACFLLFIKRHP